MIEQIKDIIWNVGGVLFTVSLIILVIGYVWNRIIHHLAGFHKKGVYNNLFYWIKNKKRINEIIDNGKKK